MARQFVAWLALPAGLRWLDVGCGTGALTEAVLRAAEPAQVTGVDRSPGYLAAARARLGDPRARFEVADAAALPCPDGVFDAVVSGLSLNFAPDPAAALAEAVRAATPGATVAAYVWDYAAGMELTRRFWDAARVLDAGAAALDEGERFPLCRPRPLAALFATALRKVTVREIVVPTVFSDFDDYWEPFLGAQGPAPAYVASLDEQQRTRLRELVRSRLPAAAGDGSIRLLARAWAVRGQAVAPQRIGVPVADASG